MFFCFLFFFYCPRLSSSNYLNYCLATCLAHLNNSVGSSAGESAHGKRNLFEVDERGSSLGFGVLEEKEGD